jgi:hypothetical protein
LYQKKKRRCPRRRSEGVLIVEEVKVSFY